MGGSVWAAAVHASALKILAQLVAANTPSLHQLSLAFCHAGDDVLRPVFAALASNTSLRTLFVQHNKISTPFARDVMLPSVRANAALRRLVMVNDEGNRVPALLEAEALVAARV